jgi:hypothetical protein
MGPDRGPCEQCKHFRKGGSVALTAFKALPDGGRLKVMLQTTVNQRRQEESAQAGSLIEERRTARQTETDEYLRRPTMPNFGYCGVDEFAGRSYCSEVKNKRDPEYSCEQFTILTEDDRVPHSCETCAHNYRPHGSLIDVLLAQVTGSGPGQHPSQLGPFKEEVEQFLHSTAEAEYEECINQDGVLSARPGLLPVCEAWSSGQRHVIGPVANAGARCMNWTPGSNDRTSQLTECLSALVASCAEAYRRYEENFARYDQAAWQLRTVIETEVGHAKADLIEFCLLFLGANAEWAASIAARYSQLIWEPANGKLAPWVSKRTTWRPLLDATQPPVAAPAARNHASQGAGTAENGKPEQALSRLLPGVWEIEDSFLGGLKKVRGVLIFGPDGTVQVRGSQGVANWSTKGGEKVMIWSPGGRTIINKFSEIQPDRLVGTVRESGSVVSGKTVWCRL